MFSKWKLGLVVGIVCALPACKTMEPILGGSSSNGSGISGAAAGGSQVDKNDGLERCEASLGTVSVFEDRSDPWWSTYRDRYPKLGSTIPLIRLMIQQSNCFVLVERGTSMKAMMRERELMQSGELRGGSNIGRGQMVAADYTITPSVLFAEKGTGGITGAATKFLGNLGDFGGLMKANGSIQQNEAQTNLTMIENRSGVQVSAAMGSAKNYDFGLAGGLFERGGGNTSVGAFSRTPEGKVVTAAFADSFNQMVRALRQYKPQTVEGGLGKGGTLKIGGEDDQMPAAKPATDYESRVEPAKPAVKLASNSSSTHYTDNSHTTVVTRSSSYISLDEVDEGAMKDYYKALKRAVEHLGNFSSITKEQRRSMEAELNKNNSFAGAMGLSMIWGGPYVNRLETSMIELETWPPEARQQAWKVYGKRIEKLNKLFDRHRDRIIKNEAFEETALQDLEYVELLTKDNFLITN